MRTSFLFFTCLVLLTLSASSQPKRSKKYRYEFIGGIGPSGFLGDLGGSYGKGNHFVKDYNLFSSRYCLDGGIRYKTNSKFAVKGMLSLAMVSGNDALSKDKIRQNRNLNFRSPIIELSVQAEYYFISEVAKNLYSISGLNSRKKRRKLSTYIFAGIGTFYYNPKEQLDGTWYSVRKYHLEGQGLPGGPKQFSNFNIAIPGGIGFKNQLDKRWSVGFEFGLRKTFTDYIDGVSTNYYNPALLLKYEGPIAVKLADPSLGRIDGATNAGQERGNPKYKDSYMFLTFNVGYKFGKKTHRTRAKF
jgi:hypothetical protein